MADLIIFRERLGGREIKLLGSSRIGRRADYWHFDTSSGLTLQIRQLNSGERPVYLVKGRAGYYQSQPYIGEFLEVIALSEEKYERL